MSLADLTSWATTARTSASPVRTAASFVRAPEEIAGPTVPASCGAEPSPQKRLVATLD